MMLKSKPKLSIPFAMYGAHRSFILLAGVLCSLLLPSQAQVEVKKQPARATMKDAWVPLPMQTAPAPKGLKGYVVYPSRVPVKGGPQRQAFDLVLRAVGREVKRDAAPVAVYRVTPPMAEVVFDPQFSDDGRTLLFKVGWPFEKSSTYRLFFWDIAKEKLLPGPKESIANQNIAWSRDGRFVAYILGGDHEGNIGNDKDSLRLSVYDRESGKSRVVASNPGVTNFAWTPQNTLLFFSFSPEAIEQSRKARIVNDPQPAIAQRPQLMEVAATEGEPKAVADNAYGNLYYAAMPPLAASPDGKWIAFYAWPEPEERGKIQDQVPTDKKKSGPPEQEYASLYLLERATGKRFPVYPFRADTQDFLTWTPDGKRLILTRTSYDEVNNRGRSQAKILVVDTQAPLAKEVATLRVEDYEPIYHRSTDPRFQPLRTSKDGLFLMLRSLQAQSPKPGIDARMTYPTFKTIQAVNLVDGSVSSLAQAVSRRGSSYGFDWSDQVPEAKEANTKKSGTKNTAANTQTLPAKEVVTLRVEDYKSINPRSIDAQFEPSGISKGIAFWLSILVPLLALFTL